MRPNPATRRAARMRRRLPLVLALCASLAGLSVSLCAAPASAGTVTNDRPFLFSFNGEGTTAGRFVNTDGAYRA